MKTRTSFLLLSALALAACGGSGGDSSPPPPQANAAPQIAPVGKQTVMANTQGTTLSVGVSDDRTATTALTISASSDNPALLPSAGIAIGASGSTVTLTVAPTPDLLGDAVITVTATDTGGLSATRDFELSVIAQSLSLMAVTRDAFALGADEDGTPLPINAVEFVQDADDDEFEDLFDL